MRSDNGAHNANIVGISQRRLYTRWSGGCRFRVCSCKTGITVKEDDKEDVLFGNGISFPFLIPSLLDMPALHELGCCALVPEQQLKR